MKSILQKLNSPFLVKQLPRYDLSRLRTVITFSIYGNVEKYIGGLLKNCMKINKIYPIFWIYVYVGNDVDMGELTKKLNGIANLEYIQTGVSGHENASHRFFGIDRPEVGIMFSRDADSEINERDQYCIQRFIQSKFLFQIIRDHPQHGTEILAGMWGIKKGLLTQRIQDMFHVFKNRHSSFVFGDDQLFLTNVIYPRVNMYTLAFDSGFAYPDAKKEHIPLPIHIDENGNSHFIGSPIYLYK